MYAVCINSTFHNIYLLLKYFHSIELTTWKTISTHRRREWRNNKNEMNEEEKEEIEISIRFLIILKLLK